MTVTKLNRYSIRNQKVGVLGKVCMTPIIIVQ